MAMHICRSTSAMWCGLSCQEGPHPPPHLVIAMAGPLTWEQLRHWYESGFLDETDKLLVCSAPAANVQPGSAKAPFELLSDAFPDPALAFIPPEMIERNKGSSQFAAAVSALAPRLGKAGGGGGGASGGAGGGGGGRGTPGKPLSDSVTTSVLNAIDSLGGASSTSAAAAAAASAPVDNDMVDPLEAKVCAPNAGDSDGGGWGRGSIGLATAVASTVWRRGSKRGSATTLGAATSGTLWTMRRRRRRDSLTPSTPPPPAPHASATLTHPRVYRRAPSTRRPCRRGSTLVTSGTASSSSPTTGGTITSRCSPSWTPLGRRHLLHPPPLPALRRHPHLHPHLRVSPLDSAL